MFNLNSKKKQSPSIEETNAFQIVDDLDARVDDLGSPQEGHDSEGHDPSSTPNSGAEEIM